MVRFCWIPVALLLLTACIDRRQRAERTLREVGPEVMRDDAALLYKELFGGRGAGFTVIGKSAWPPSFQRFQPRRVGAYPDGFSLALETAADTEEGLFVIPTHFERRVPTGAVDDRFERLAEGIYWYAFARSGPGRE